MALTAGYDGRMEPKPTQWLSQYGNAFKDRSVAEAYVHRQPYPEGIYQILLAFVVDALGTCWS